jgi:ribosome-associated translation inhibitor RaiA
VTTDTKAATTEVSEILLELMKVTPNEDGTATIEVSLPKNGTTLANGTYNFKVTPQVTSGISNVAYALTALTFKVTIENKMPTIASATVKGSIDLVKRDVPVTIQIAMSKQNYDSVGNITEVKLCYKGSNDVNEDLIVDTTQATDGLISVKLKKDVTVKKGASFTGTLRVKSSTGKIYTKDVTIKTTQSACTVKAAESNTTFYTSIGEASIPLTVTDGIKLDTQSIEFKAKSTFSVTVKGKKTTYNVSDYFDCDLYYAEDGVAYVHLQTKKKLPDGLAGTKLTLNFTALPVGNAEGQAAVAFTASVTFK